MAQYAVVNILKYKDDCLYFSDDDSKWEKVSEETVTGFPKQNELVLWVAGPGVKRITSIDFEDINDFKRPPKAKYKGRMWFAKIKEDAVIGNEPKYTISFIVDGKELTVDPKIKIEGGGGG